MKLYNSRSGKQPGVTAFEIDDDSITVYFGDECYRYSNFKTGMRHVEIMKSKALAQNGLSTYIAQNRTILKFTKC